jgi:hypothetical protein
MEDYVIDVTPTAGDFGKNLIASALGPDAQFARFSPSPTKSQANVEASDEPSTGGTNSPAAIHGAKTEIFDPASKGKRTRSSSAKDVDPSDPIHQEKTHVGGPRR